MELSKIKNSIKNHIVNLEKDISEIKDKIDKDFMYAYEWGYHALLYYNTWKYNTYLEIYSFLIENDNEVEIKEYINNIINGYINELLTRKLEQNSTNKYSNDAYIISLEVKQELIKKLKYIN